MWPNIFFQIGYDAGCVSETNLFLAMAFLKVAVKLFPLFPSDPKNAITAVLNHHSHVLDGRHDRSLELLLIFCDR